MQQVPSLALSPRQAYFEPGWRRLPGIQPPQVQVRVDQPRHHPRVAQVDHLAAAVRGRRMPGSERFDPPTGNPNRDIRLIRSASAIQQVSG